MKYAIRCNKCGWLGNDDDLKYINDENDSFDGCPNCNDDKDLMDLDEESWDNAEPF